jgi:hypothetical protein
MFKATSMTLGANATKVLTRIKLAIDPEPKLGDANGHLSNAWVEWHMRQTGAPRMVAINRGYNLLDFEGDTISSATTFKIDEALAILGVNVLEDYFFHSKRMLKEANTVRVNK